MSAIVRNTFECINPDPESGETLRRGSEMTFWGLLCVGGKCYSSVVKRRFRLTMAVLDPRSYNSTFKERTCLVTVHRDNEEFLLCVLRHGQIEQCSLNVVFEQGESIRFQVDGYGVVFLTGYHICGIEGDIFNNRSTMPPIGRVPKSIENFRIGYSDKLNAATLDKEETVDDSKAENGNEPEEEDDDDEDDEDYVANDDSSESTENSDMSVKNAEEIDSDELTDEKEAEELLEDAKEIFQSSPDSRKRKTLKTPQSKKRLKVENAAASTSKDADLICLDNDSDDSGKSIDDTLVAEKQMKSPVATKQMNTSMATEQMDSSVVPSEKKKRKKKKSIGASLYNDENAGLIAARTPNKTKQKNSIIQMTTGIETQDVKVGHGPVATKGKLIHIFYMGRLEDKQIFDARRPPNKPMSFKLGVGHVLPGLDEGIEGMKVGGIRKIKVPPKMGYGNKTVGKIPPNSTLYFIVDLQAIS